METPGSLIDKLITVDMKMYHNQELLYEIRRGNYKDFCKRFKIIYLEEDECNQLENPFELYSILKKACDFNVQRNKLIEEIDEKFEKLTGVKLVFKQHKTY